MIDLRATGLGRDQSHIGGNEGYHLAAWTQATPGEAKVAVDSIDKLTGVANRQTLLAGLFSEVERASRYVMLLHLPHGRTAEDVRTALTRQITKLPLELRRPDAEPGEP